MEDKNTVTYFLFNDRKGTSRCSFILICSLAFFEFYSCFTYILPLLYPKHGTILFCLPLFFLSISPLFYSNSSPYSSPFLSSYTLISSLISIKKLLHFNFIPPHLERSSNLFNLHSRPFFLSKSPPFPLVYSHLNPNQNYFSTPPQSLCNKGMATLSCNSNDIAPQKQCNCHLKALLLERKSYSFAPQRLYP